MSRIGRPRTAPSHGLSAYANGRCRCEVCLQAWEAYSRQYRARKRERGECRECSRPVKGTMLCDVHRAKHNQWTRDWRAKMRRIWEKHHPLCNEGVPAGDQQMPCNCPEGWPKP